VIGGKQRENAVVQAPSVQDMKHQRFHVVKINNMGRHQKRILVIDQQRQEIRSFDQKMRLHVILPLNKLHQLENLEADDCSLELSFEEGVYSYCELLFQTTEERARFIEVIMKQHESVEDNKSAIEANEPMNIMRRQMKDISILLLSLHQRGASSGSANRNRNNRVTGRELNSAIDRLTEHLEADREVAEPTKLQNTVADVVTSMRREKISLSLIKKAKARRKSRRLSKANVRKMSEPSRKEFVVNGEHNETKTELASSRLENELHPADNSVAVETKHP
jgi:hypothetical protein